jgi:hypothetical protein
MGPLLARALCQCLKAKKAINAKASTKSTTPATIRIVLEGPALTTSAGFPATAGGGGGGALLDSASAGESAPGDDGTGVPNILVNSPTG